MLKKGAVAFVFLVIFTVDIRPIESGDFWWHIATGRWITEHRALPDEDPFSYTETGEPDPLKSLVLKTYWISQLLLYHTYDNFGSGGVIIVRALIFTFMSALLYLILRGYGVAPALSLIMPVLITPAMASYIEARPNAASLVMSLLLFLLIEKLRRAERPHRDYKKLLLLPALMFVWSNMHGGFSVGIVMIGFFAALEAVRAVRHGPDRRAAVLIGVSAAAIGASALNPNGLNTFVWLLMLKTEQMASAQSIHEYFSPIRFYLLTGDSVYLYSIYIAFGAMALSFALNFRRTDPFHLALAAVFSYAALSHFRFGSFLFLFGASFAGRNIACLAGRIKISLGRYAFAASAALAALVLALERPSLGMGLEEDVLPIEAAWYVQTSHPPAELFGTYEWGGYLIWTLYPGYKTFIDGRALDDRVYAEYIRVVTASPDADRILEKRGVNTVLTYTIKPVDEKVPRVAFRLLKSEGWEPVYWDLKSIIFVREGLAEKAVPKPTVWRALLSLAQAQAMLHPEDPDSHAVLGEVYYEMGLFGLARENFMRALSADPENEKALRFMGALVQSGGRLN